MVRNKFTIICLCQGDSADSAFTMDVCKSSTVSSLRESIKEERAHRFHDIDESALTLWKVNIPKDDEASIQQLILKDDKATKMLPAEKISKYFRTFRTKLAKERIHVVIGYRPGKCLSSTV
jgi:Crinkler effector protein N-terminal domain